MPEPEYYGEWDLFDKRTHDAFAWPSLLPREQRPLVYGFVVAELARAFISQVAGYPLDRLWLTSPIELSAGALSVLPPIVNVGLFAVSLSVGLIVAYRYLRSPASLWLLFLVPLAAELTTLPVLLIQISVPVMDVVSEFSGQFLLNLGVGVLGFCVAIAFALFVRRRWLPTPA